jgi:gluconate 5-dehydrogenase
MANFVLEAHGERLLDHIPLRRFGGDADLKGTIALLASRAGDYVTGQTLVVDGGQSAW